MEENNYLVESFGNSIGADIAEFAGEAVEFTLDTCVGEDGILKDIPFVGAALKLCNITSKVQEKYSFYKLKAFIQEINAGTVTPEKLEERKQKFLSKAKFRQKELEYILILIDRYVRFDKARMLAKLYLAYLDGDIIWEEFTMYAEVIDRFLLLDCGTLISADGKVIVHRNIGGESVLRLEALGLMTETNENSIFEQTSRGFGISAASMERFSANDKTYIRTEFGDKLAVILR
ncbi:MAG: hypothetical protein IJB27_07115 [Clostridia bacterium]|nr:hypothetical protein [Clostridia bacterium]